MRKLSDPQRRALTALRNGLTLRRVPGSWATMEIVETGQRIQDVTLYSLHRLRYVVDGPWKITDAGRAALEVTGDERAAVEQMRMEA